MVSVIKVRRVIQASEKAKEMLEDYRSRGSQGLYKYLYIRLLANGYYDIGLLVNKPKNPSFYNQLYNIYHPQTDKVRNREIKINKLVQRIQKSARKGNEIKNVNFAKHLMNERMSDEELNNSVWQFLSFDKKSGKLFKEYKTDPTLPIVFVDINYLRNHKGNKISQSKETIGKSVDKIKELIKNGVKINSVPIFFINDNEVGEGNHRVEALYQLGYKTAPVFITGAWD